MKNKIIFAAVVVIVFCVAAVAGYYGPTYLEQRHDEQLRQSFVPPGVPKSVLAQFSPQFSGVHVATEPKFLPDIPFLSTKGQETRISDFAGKPTLVNFWATWCAPCIVELPSLQRLADHYAGKLNVIAVALEDGKTPEAISAFLEKRDLGDFAGYVNSSGGFLKNLEIRGVPTSFLIGSDGLILYRFDGDADWASEDSRAFFDVFVLQNR